MLSVTDIYDKYYPKDSASRSILERHSKSVAEKALQINRERHLGLDDGLIYQAAMLHDIGIFLTDAGGIGCFGSEPYIRHGILGADLLRREGVSEAVARVAERHTGAGITADDIATMQLPLPSDRILYPVTMLEQLVCYADKFFSKSGDMQPKSLERVRASMLRHSPDTLRRFEILHALFGQR